MADENLATIAPAAVRYIKLGAGGMWEAASLDGDRIDWGHESDSHVFAAAGEWDKARDVYIEQGVLPATATGYVRELKDFYTLGADTLWITFARGSLWWAFAEPEVINRGVQTATDASRYRRTIGQWRSTDIIGRPLPMHTLSTKLTQLAGYRRTICSVGPKEYLLRRINAQEEPAITRARIARLELIESASALIEQLHWAEFELLVDLLFQRAGWRRVSMLGGTMKDIDLLVEQPVTGERASVQVKSAADQATLDANIAAFEASATADRFFFVCHSARGQLAVPAELSDRVRLWGLPELGAACVDGGLVDWLIDKAA